MVLMGKIKAELGAHCSGIPKGRLLGPAVGGIAPSTHSQQRLESCPVNVRGAKRSAAENSATFTVLPLRVWKAAVARGWRAWRGSGCTRVENGAEWIWCAHTWSSSLSTAPGQGDYCRGVTRAGAGSVPTHSHTHTCTHIPMHTHTRTDTHTHTHAQTLTHTCTLSCTHTHIPMHTHTHTHTYPCTHTHTHTHIPMHIHTHMHTHTHSHTHIPMHTHTLTHTHTHTHIHSHTYSLTHTHTHTHTPNVLTTEISLYSEI